MAPQFKKLTDCPENLREAIDWLIQIKNGGDGGGIKRLSEALKQLIDEAVEKAKETMKHKRRKLECANDYYERPYCTELDEMCAKAKEKLKEFLSGKNSVSDKNDLESKIKHHESNKKDCINSHDIDDRRKDEIQKEINNAEQVVAKLEKFSDRLDEYKGTDDNILNTICDGLEHFLGYNSKNYNGHGIVYGDSDRFRDAILMFLHGVLECARNNPNIKNVDAYIFILNPVIQSLYSARWNGKDGFDSAVQKVIEGVGKYFDKVKEHNALVMNPITDLIGEIDEKLDMNDYTKTLTLAEQLEQLNGSASSYNSLATDAEEALSNVDEEHKKKLEIPIQIMKQSVENFKQAAGNIDLAKQCKDVDEKLKSLPSEVNSKIEQDVAQFIKDHEKYIEHLKTGIVHDFEKRLNGWISRVDAALEATKTKGVTSIENLQSEFEKAIQALHKELKDRVNKIDVSNLSTNVSEFKKSFNVVEEQLKKLTKDDGGKIPKGLLQSTEETIKKQLQNFVIQAHQVNDQLSNIKKSLNDWLTKNKDADENSDGLSALSKDVNKKIENFKNEYNTIHAKLDGIKKFVEENSDKQTLEELIGNITVQVTALDDKVANDLNMLKTRVYGAMKAVIVDIQKGVAEAANSGSGSSSALLIQDFRVGMRADRSDAKSLVAWTKAAESGGDLKAALEQLHQVDNQFTKFQGILQALESFKHDNKNFFDVITQDLKDKVAQTALALNNASHNIVKSNFATTMTQYRRHLGNSGPKSSTTIYGAIAAVSESVTSLGEAYSGTTKADAVLKELVDTLPAQMKQLTTSVAEVISKLDNNNTHLEKIVEEATRLHKELQEDYKNGLYKKFSALREAVNVSGRQFDEVKYQLNTVLTEAKLQLEALESLPDKIKNAERTGTNALVATFTKEVMEIKIAANKLGNEKKEHCINDTKNVLDSAHRSAAGYIRQLGRQCIAAVTHAFKEITQHVQSQYASSNNAHYEALKRCVAAQKLKITTIMENDLKTGLKGFLKTVSGVAANSQTISGTGNKIAELKDMNNVKDLSVKLKAYLEQIFYYVIEQLNLNPTSGRVGSSEHSARSKSPLNDPNVSGIYTIYKIVNDVTQSLATSNSFNHAILDKIHEAYLAIPKFVPSKFFSMPSNPLLDILKSGFDGFAKELKNVYVSKYSGAIDTFNWDILGNSEKCAKVCSTIFEILHRDLTKLKTICEGGSNAKQINLQIIFDGGRKVVNPLGDFFNQRGYKVPSGASTQDAELRNDTNIKGEQIKDLLYKNYNIFASLHSADDNALYDGPLVQFYNNILDYHSVCHLKDIKNANSPYNAFQMLCWLSGLQYNPTYHPLKEYMKTFFKKAEKHKDTEYSRIPFVDLKVEATSPFSARDTVSALRLVTVKSHDILTTLLGHGHAGGIYACDFKTNPGNLSYPNDSGACFDLLVEILLRLNHQLSFLYEQCCHTTKVSGWSDCWYGKGVGGSNWRCNDLKCAECTGADNCKTHPICGIKSPLQSFLEDGLKGFLPHTFTKLRCKLECSVSNHNGIPCKTPMGFSDIGTVASHRQTGQRIKDVLRSFCGNKNSPLNQLCSYLICFLRTPPRTLGEMFAFYYAFLHDWNDSGVHRKDGFNNAVIKANFGNSTTSFDITSMFKSTDHADNHLKGDLYSLISCSNTYIPARPCGPYMRPLCIFSRDMYSKEYSGYYLSWVVYLTETFYDLLKKFYEDCNKSCGSKGSTCYDKSCVRSCPISRDPSSSAHDPLCKSMVDCTSTLPTLCKYGFYFGSATLASGSKGDTMKRTCKEFILHLRNVCEGNSVLAKLVYVTIPEFLFQIRAPFIWLNVALWLLSLLYLIHIMVIRLDLLHIKSHLHSPSSHRIAAQSLLAAARVKALNKVLYLQP